jgi:putative endonuclease
MARWESRTFFVYMMGSRLGVLYIGVTNNLERRVGEHRAGLTPGFTKKYRVRRLL